MTSVEQALDKILEAHRATGRSLAVILAGHNGSGKSTLWRRSLAAALQIPLINADRMMLSILPEPNSNGHLPPWAKELRDTNTSWMRVAQQGVEAFVGHAIAARAPFGMETVFSHWEKRTDGTIASKIEQIKRLQDADYFVLLIFVGLSNDQLSILRVQSRVLSGGHDVDESKLRQRFPRTQTAIRNAAIVADATILTDNSLTPDQAFRVCRVQMRTSALFDIREAPSTAPPAITQWLDIVSPQPPKKKRLSRDHSSPQ